jgi:hypothetical protein
MAGCIWDLSGTDRQCASYGPGHLIHWIHFNHSMREPSVVIPVTASVDDDDLAHIEGDDLSLVRWNHRPALVRAALVSFGGMADWKPRWHLLLEEALDGIRPHARHTPTDKPVPYGPNDTKTDHGTQSDTPKTGLQITRMQDVLWVLGPGDRVRITSSGYSTNCGARQGQRHVASWTRLSGDPQPPVLSETLCRRARLARSHPRSG